MEGEQITLRVDVDELCSRYEINDIEDIAGYEMDEILEDYLAENYPTLFLTTWEFSMDETEIIIYAQGR